MPDQALLLLVDRLVSGLTAKATDCESLARASTAAIGDHVLAEKLFRELHDLLTRTLAAKGTEPVLPNLFNLAARIEIAIQDGDGPVVPLKP